MMTTVYLPMIHKGGAGLLKRPGFAVGASAGGILDAQVYARLGLQVVNLNNFLWSRFEPVQGEYDYAYLNEYFKVWRAAVALGIPALVTFFGIPRWAQIDPLGGDSPMRLVFVPDFVAMIRRVVREVPELVYVQVLNEPDNEFGYEDHYGCLGDPLLYLVIMRQVAEIRREFPGLVLSIGLTTYTTDFFKKYIDAGGALYIDQYNVHFYQGWGQVNPPQLADEVSLARGMGCPVWVTEANLLHDGAATPEYLDDQAGWVGRQCGIARELGCEAFLPYALWSNWRNANILGLPAEAVLTDLAKLNN